VMVSPESQCTFISSNALIGIRKNLWQTELIAILSDHRNFCTRLLSDPMITREDSNIVSWSIIFFSVLHETMQHRHTICSARYCTDDTTWLRKKIWENNRIHTDNQEQKNFFLSYSAAVWKNQSGITRRSRANIVTDTSRTRASLWINVDTDAISRSSSLRGSLITRQNLTGSGWAHCSHDAQRGLPIKRYHHFSRRTSWRGWATCGEVSAGSRNANTLVSKSNTFSLITVRASIAHQTPSTRWIGGIRSNNASSTGAIPNSREYPCVCVGWRINSIARRGLVWKTLTNSGSASSQVSGLISKNNGTTIFSPYCSVNALVLVHVSAPKSVALRRHTSFLEITRWLLIAHVQSYGTMSHEFHASSVPKNQYAVFWLKTRPSSLHHLAI